MYHHLKKKDIIKNVESEKMFIYILISNADGNGKEMFIVIIQSEKKKFIERK